MISVILPVFNEPNIQQVVESLLAQDYDNFEVIAIDDCSTDGTKEILKKIKNKKLKLILRKVNGGPGPARNDGIKKAKGDLILFFDSDVKLINLGNKKEQFITEMNKWFNKLKDNNLSETNNLAGVEAQQVFPVKGNYWQKLFYHIPGLPGNTNIDNLGDYHKCGFASTTASLWKKSIIIECDGLDERLRLGDDMKLSYSALQKCYKFFSVPVFVEHQYRKSLRAFLKEQFWYGVGGGITLTEGYQHDKRLKWVLLVAPLGLITVVIWPWTVLLPLLIYLPNSLKRGLKMMFPLMIVQYLKHVANILGAYHGLFKGDKAFNYLKGRH